MKTIIEALAESEQYKRILGFDPKASVAWGVANGKIHLGARQAPHDELEAELFAAEKRRARQRAQMRRLRAQRKEMCLTISGAMPVSQGDKGIDEILAARIGEGLPETGRPGSEIASEPGLHLTNPSERPIENPTKLPGEIQSGVTG